MSFSGFCCRGQGGVVGLCVRMVVKFSFSVFLLNIFIHHPLFMLCFQGKHAPPTFCLIAELNISRFCRTCAYTYTQSVVVCEEVFV